MALNGLFLNGVEKKRGSDYRGDGRTCQVVTPPAGGIVLAARGGGGGHVVSFRLIHKCSGMGGEAKRLQLKEVNPLRGKFCQGRWGVGS